MSEITATEMHNHLVAYDKEHGDGSAIAVLRKLFGKNVRFSQINRARYSELVEATKYPPEKVQARKAGVPVEEPKTVADFATAFWSKLKAKRNVG